ncbi:MAG: TonB-dependent receptor [Saprospiraceae bacterium]|nr:TonB-dependent receptor [Saprospiraceae bacterium]MDP4698598.1 TonB-dependent receptor [Saprospiraceae bacterium]MDP4812570.1 TonB-dependent receptor [Saprospiraceae bacterium]MDP4912861.1 TonB-dependent receptor [Saprospiraceae bacterium]MDP5049935.1 TonB-dependent receptor [Saprospiraceae bacterium]
MRNGFKLPVLTVCFLTFLKFNTLAQCDQSVLIAATQDYEEGLFSEAKQPIISCFMNEKFSDLKLTNDAYRLLSLIAIAEDSIALASKYIRKIIQSNPDYQGPAKHFIFDGLVKQVLEKNQVITVSAVSKKAEDIRVAPASVLIIKKEEMVERGYIDLIDVLSNLPGFDISKYYGVVYANVYQLGFRQENTERTLLMINGIEENDNWSNIAYISRQYPLSNIKAIEILYGPSSTMYGPRAFVGTINIITYDSGEVIPFQGKSKKSVEKTNNNPFYVNGTVSGGSYTTRDADFTIGFKKDAINTTFTFKSFQSDHRIEDFNEFFDYQPDDVNQLNYDHLNIKKPVPLNINGTSKTFSIDEYAALFNINSNSFINVFKNLNGTTDSITLTPEGVSKARLLDKDAYTGLVNGQPSGYSNQMRDSYIGIKIGFPNLVIGIRAWKTSESFGFYQDLYSAGTKNGNKWAVSNATFYSMFNKTYNRFSFSNITSFTNNRLDKNTARVNYFLLGNKSLPLHLAHFVYPDSLLPNVTGAPVRQGYGNLFYYYDAQLFRNDFRFFYQNDRFNITSGLEIRFSQQYGDYLYYLDFPAGNDGLLPENENKAQELGATLTESPGGNIYNIFDMALYFSGTYKIIPSKLNVSFGNRIDNNTIRGSGGFGVEFSPRLALVFLGKEISGKLVFSHGIQNVSQFHKYSTGNNRKPNPQLGTEKIDYFDLSLNGAHKSNRIRWTFVLFNYFISDAVASVTINEPPFNNQNKNVGVYRVSGSLFDFNYSFMDRKWSVFLNHTFNLPFQQPPIPGDKFIRVADISSQSANLGLTHRLNKKNFLLSTHIYANYVGERPVGPGTTAPNNLGLYGENIPAYLIFNTTINYSNSLLKGTMFSLIINNLLDTNLLDTKNKTYFHPGIRTASGAPIPGSFNGLAPFFPQRGRQISIRMLINIAGS